MRHSAHLLQRVHVSLTRRREHRRRLALHPCVFLLGTQELRTRSEQFDLGGGSTALSCSRRLRGHRRLREEEEREEEIE